MQYSTYIYQEADKLGELPTLSFAARQEAYRYKTPCTVQTNQAEQKIRK